MEWSVSVRGIWILVVSSLQVTQNKRISSLLLYCHFRNKMTTQFKSPSFMVDFTINGKLILPLRKKLRKLCYKKTYFDCRRPYCLCISSFEMKWVEYSASLLEVKSEYEILKRYLHWRNYSFHETVGFLR